MGIHIIMARGKKSGKSTTRSAMAGLQFPVGRVHRHLRTGRYAARVGLTVLSLSAFALIAIAAADPTSDVVPEDDQVHGILTMPSDHAIMGWGPTPPPTPLTCHDAYPGARANWPFCPAGTTFSPLQSCSAYRDGLGLHSCNPALCCIALNCFAWSGSCPAGQTLTPRPTHCTVLQMCDAARCCIAQTPPPATSCGTDIDHLFKCTSRGSVHRRPHKPWKLPCGDDGVCQEKECCKLTCKDFSCAMGKHCPFKAVSRRPFKPEKLGCSWDIGCSCNTCCKQAN